MAAAQSFRSHPAAPRCACHKHVSVTCNPSARSASPQVTPAAVAGPSRRSWLAAGAAWGLAPLLQAAGASPALAEDTASSSSSSSSSSGSGGGGSVSSGSRGSIEVVAEEPGSGTAAARPGDLVLVHYVATVEPEGTLFDSTRGGQMYRDGGVGVLRPVIIRLGGSPVPGVCAGLQQGIQGMTVGGRRTLLVPPSQGFGAGTVLGPYGVVPGGSTLRYEIELLRLSRRGPDALMSGISQCGGGFANERTTGCADISPAEFV